MKRLTERQFEQAVSQLEIGEQTILIARGVLVEGKSQADFARAMNITKSAVSQAVNRVWNAYKELAEVPDGYEKVTVILPRHQAYQVRKWAKEAKGL